MRAFFFLAVLLFTSSAFAAEVGPAHRLQPGEVLRGHFDQTHYMKNATKPVESEGHFVLAPDYGLIWAMEKPIPITFVVTAAGMTQAVGGVPLFHEDATRAGTFIRLVGMVTDVMGGNWDSVGKNFVVQSSGDHRKWTVKITPKPATDAEKVMKLVTVNGAERVEGAKLIEQSGSEDKITFTNQTITKGKPTAEEEALFNKVY
jgi:hypothetical protein